MAYRLRELPEAKAELRRAAACQKALSPAAASKLLSDYRAKAELLASGALTQDPCSHPVLARLGYRKALIGANHLILYYIEGDDLVVAHFFSQREDYANLV